MAQRQKSNHHQKQSDNLSDKHHHQQQQTNLLIKQRSVKVSYNQINNNYKQSEKNSNIQKEHSKKLKRSNKQSHKQPHHQSHKQSHNKFNNENNCQSQQKQQDIVWEAAYHDNKFYLSDPNSIQKLKELEEQIKKEKIKLQSLQNQNNQYSYDKRQRKHSFLQPKQEQSDHQKSIKSHINNISLLQKRKQKAQTDLLEEQDKYKSKIQLMKKNLRQKHQKQKQKNKVTKKKQQTNQIAHAAESNTFKNMLKSQKINKNDKQVSINKQFTDKYNNKLQVPSKNLDQKFFKKDKAVKDLNLESNTSNRLGNQLSIKEKQKKSQHQKNVSSKTNELVQQKKAFNSIKLSQNSQANHSQRKEIESDINSKTSKIKNQLFKESIKSHNPHQQNSMSSKKSSAKNNLQNRSINNKNLQIQQNQELISIQKQQNLINKSVQWSQKQFSNKSSKKKQQLYEFLNKNQVINQQSFIKKKNPSINGSQHLKRQSVAIPIFISSEDIAQNDINQQQKLKDSKVSSKKSQKSKDNNRSFLIHYPKQKSQSSKKSSNRYNKKLTQEDQILNKLSQSANYKTKPKSLVNQDKLKKSLIYKQPKSDLSQIQMIPKGQLVKLRIQMQELKKQLNLILQNQQKSSFINYHEQSNENKNKILVESREKSRHSIQKSQSLNQKQNKSKQQEKLLNYPQFELPQVKTVSFSPSRLHRRMFNIQSSIVQFDFLEQKKKKIAIQDQKQQKARLNIQIDRLKKIIRQLRIQKIKSSIEGSYNQNLNSINQFQQNRGKQSFLPIQQQNQSLIQQKGQTSRYIQKMKEPQQIGTITATLENHQISRNHEKSQIYEALQDSKISKNYKNNNIVGKIIKNSPQKQRTIFSETNNPQSNLANNLVFNTKRRGSEKKYEPVGFQISKDQKNDPLPKRGTASLRISSNAQNSSQFSNEYIHKVNENSKEFQKFVKESHINQDIRKDLAQDNIKNNQVDMKNNFKKGISPKNSNRSSRIQSFLKNSKYKDSQDSMDQGHQLNHQAKYENLKQQNDKERKAVQNSKSFLEDIYVDEIKQLQQIKFSNISIPQLPQAPSYSMNQQQLISLAKETYRIFGIQTEKDQKQGFNLSYNRDSSLILKKYKNCVFFTTPLTDQIILWDYSGRFYMGGWKKSVQSEGQKSGQGIQYAPGKHLYKGQFLKGKKNGMGIIKYQNGNIYQGQFSQGSKNGRGKLFQASTGVIYDGQWKQNKKDGSGILIFSSKQYYDGTFVKSMKHGFGYETFSNEDQYKGQYCRGKFHGKGKYIWGNGSIYEGNFVDGLRSGQGIWRSSRMGSISDQYIGQYHNDKKNGYGRYSWVNGCVYEGYFQNDLKHGKGRLIYDDGKQVKGNWNMGNLVSTQNGKKAFQNQQQPIRRSIKYSSFMMDEVSNDTGKKFVRNSRSNVHQEM